MICPKCHKPYLFMSHSNDSRVSCRKCKYQEVFKQPTYEGYVESTYDKKLLRTSATDPLLARFINISKLKDAQTVLDYGCGRGDYVKEMSLYTKDVVGVDIDITLAQRTFPDLKFRKIESVAIDTPDAAFDWIVCVNVIEHVHDHDALLNEFRRLLKPEGKLFITTFDIDFILHSIHYDPTHLIEWTQHEFESLISKKFKIVSSFKAGSMFNFYPLNIVLTKMLTPELCIVAKKNNE